MELQIKVPLDVYDRNAHRKYVRQQKRYQKRLEEERSENERREKEIAKIQRRNGEICDLVINMHDLDKKVLCKSIFDILTDREKTVLYMRYYQNKSMAVIAEEIGVSKGRIYQLEKHLLLTLKRKLFIGCL